MIIRMGEDIFDLQAGKSGDIHYVQIWLTGYVPDRYCGIYYHDWNNGLNNRWYNKGQMPSEIFRACQKMIVNLAFL